MKEYIAIIIVLALILSLLLGCKPKKIKDNEAFPPMEEQPLADSELDKLFTELRGSETFSGYVFVSKQGRVLIDKAYGKADYAKGTKISKQTKFDIASITKQFTAVAVMQLHEKGLLNVSDKVSKYLTAFPHGDEITIHQLLNHTSGLPEHSVDFDITKFRPTHKRFGIAGMDENVALEFRPGSSFLYSGTGYILLGYIIEKISGITLDMYFSENIFKPLDMKNTGFKDESGQLSNLATGYQNGSWTKALKPWNLLHVGPVLGASALCASVEDLIKWEQALSEGKLLSKESYNKIYTPYRSGYGYGWYIDKDSKGNRNYEHFGYASGYRSYILRKVDEDTRVIIVSNNMCVPMESIAGRIKNYLQNNELKFHVLSYIL